jgi:transmembrane sensor
MEPHSTSVPPAEPDWLTLDRYLAGIASAAEQASVDQWLAANPGERTEMLVLARVLREGEVVPAPATRTVSPPSMPSRRAVAHRHTWAWGTAAVAAALVGVIALGTFVRRGAAPERSAKHVYIAPAGHRATVTLADGARALLAPATTITTQRSAAGTVVSVQGAALFTVTHDDRAPFVVRMGSTDVRVLGTTFMVRHYTYEPLAHVAVTEGRVSVRSTDTTAATAREIVLTENMVAMVDDSGRIRRDSAAVASDYTAWTTGRLVFRDAPVREIVAEIGRTYGVDIRLADTSASARRMTWTVPVATRTLDDVLLVLTDLLGAHSTRAGRLVTIAPGRRTPVKPVRTLPSLTTEPQYGR